MTQVVSTMLLGAFFDQLSDRTENLIQTAHGAGDSLLVQAGQQVRQAIDNAKAAYSESLNETIEKVDRVVIGQLAALVDRAQQRNAETLRQLALDAQTFVNTLPMANLFPQVKAVSPKLVALGSVEPVKVTVEGNFATAAMNGSTPTFTVNGHTGLLVENTTQKLSFLVARGAFQLPLNQGTLLFPSEPPSFSYLSSLLCLPNPPPKAPFTFRTLFETAPSIPGTLSISWTPSATQSEAKWNWKEVNHVGSKKTQTYTHQASPGSKISEQNKDYWERIPACRTQPGPNAITASRVGNLVTVSVNSPLTFDFSIRFQEEKGVTTVGSPKSEEVELKWNTEGDKPLKSGARVTFRGFDGTVSEVTSATPLTLRHVSVIRQGDNLHIQVKSPEDFA